ncbi:chromate efflux transporter [Pseudogracilibacillus auburnensis]|uniref:chromate efflux transporter n=1 Tax=Pseudogracilibacillus auburnensis TaxID=1494959 RepID=UPI001A964F09|nr:chromate efflux transporter [Pseudogracilibacillus auburnensis]MBO1003987.1 chromate efflux transporter [Pseudogracilibacillus auburnensis]
MNQKKHSLWEIFRVSSKLGLTSFGGPIAHLGYFKNEYIDKRKWLDDKTYADIIALCQFLPGPASSQVGMAIGILRGGMLGGLLSFIGFTLPSVLVLILFALLYQNYDIAHAGWIHGLKLVAVAVVAQAVLGMGQKLAPDKPRVSIAIVAAIFTLLWPSAIGQIAIIVVTGIIGVFLYKNQEFPKVREMSVSLSKKAGMLAFVTFFLLLFGLPLLRQLTGNHLLSVFDAFYRAGSLVFGGGHVVLPLLERELVPTGWVGADEFLAGYGMAQAVPGPLFTFASYLGTMMGGVSVAIIATIAIFLPAFLLVVGSLPFLNEIRKRPLFQAALTAINAAVVGILLAALYNPIWTSTVNTTIDFTIVLALFGLLTYWKWPAWIVVLVGALVGFIFA